MAFVFVGRQIKYTDTYSNTVHGHTSTKFPDTNKGQPHNTPGKGERAVTLEKSLLINNKQRPCVCYFSPLLFPWWLFKQCSLLLVYPEFWDGCKQMRIYDVIFASGCFYDVMVFFCMLGWSEVTQSCPIYDFKTLNLKYRSVQLRRNGSIWFDKRLSTASLNFFYLMVVFFFCFIQRWRLDCSWSYYSIQVCPFLLHWRFTLFKYRLQQQINFRPFFKSETQNNTPIDFAVCSWPKLKVQ